MSEEHYTPTDNDTEEYVKFVRQQTVDAMNITRSLGLSPIQAAMLSIQAAIRLGGAVIESARGSAPDERLEKAAETLLASILDDVTKYLPVKVLAHSCPASTDMAAVMGVVKDMTAEPSGDKP